jgi:hypothetical protein
MQGKLLAAIRRDAQKFATAGGFEEDITLTNPGGTQTITLTGLATGRWQSYLDTDGKLVNSASYHISVPEKALTDLEYVVRSPTSGKVKLENHRVTVKDNTGVPRNYVVNECFPNSTTGLIVLILGIAV